MSRGPQMQMSVPPFTRAVKWIIVTSVVVWFLGQVILESFFHIPFTRFLSLTPAKVLLDFQLWQLFTYMFLHSVQQVSHILFNLLMLWFLGSELESRWGSKTFTLYYLLNGAGAALVYTLGMAAYAASTGEQVGLIVPVVGASGALFSIMVAYAWFYGDRTIYFFMLFPMKARYFVMILAFVQLASLLTSSVSGGEVAYLAHLGGLASGFLTLWVWDRWQKHQWMKKSRKKSRNLRLVVDNEKEDKKNPKYWN